MATNNKQDKSIVVVGLAYLFYFKMDNKKTAIGLLYMFLCCYKKMQPTICKLPPKTQFNILLDAVSLCIGYSSDTFDDFNNGVKVDDRNKQIAETMARLLPNNKIELAEVKLFLSE